MVEVTSGGPDPVMLWLSLCESLPFQDQSFQAVNALPVENLLADRASVGFGTTLSGHQVRACVLWTLLCRTAYEVEMRGI